MKKAAIVILAILFLFAFSVSSFAAVGQVSASSASGKAGDTVNISVSVSDNPGIIAMIVSVEYDTSALELTAVKNTELFGKGTALLSENLKKVPFIITVEDSLFPANHNENGTIAVLSFRIKSSAKGSVPIKLNVDERSTFDFDMNPVGFSVKNGSVTVISDEKPYSQLHQEDTTSVNKAPAAKPTVGGTSARNTSASTTVSRYVPDKTVPAVNSTPVSKSTENTTVYGVPGTAHSSVGNAEKTDTFRTVQNAVEEKAEVISEKNEDYSESVTSGENALSSEVPSETAQAAEDAGQTVSNKTAVIIAAAVALLLCGAAAILKRRKH